MKIIFVIAVIAAGILINIKSLLPAWCLVFVSLSAFTFVCGQVVTGRKLGALIDERNVMSLSRFQIVLWTLLILSAYLTAALYNISIAPDLLAETLKKDGPLGIRIQEELWWLMGIATTTLVGSPLILSDKANKMPVSSEVTATFKLLENQGDQESTLATKGHIVVNTDISKARWSDMFTGEEVGNAAHLDVARLQMFFFTLIAALAYAVMLGNMFYGGATQGFTSLPPLNQSMIALIAISHTGYLTAKAVPRSQTGTAQQAPQAATVASDEHPAMG